MSLRHSTLESEAYPNPTEVEVMAGTDTPLTSNPRGSRCRKAASPSMALAPQPKPSPSRPTEVPLRSPPVTSCLMWTCSTSWPSILGAYLFKEVAAQPNLPIQQLEGSSPSPSTAHQEVNLEPRGEATARERRGVGEG